MNSRRIIFETHNNLWPASFVVALSFVCQEILGIHTTGDIRRKLGAKQVLHTRHTGPVFENMQAGVWLRAMETEISAALWALVVQEGWVGRRS